MNFKTLELKPIGIVRSPIADLSLMPSEGVPASILIYPDFNDGLKDLSNNSHYYIFGWLDKSDRNILQVSPRKKRELPPRGVFSLRAPVRPNPVSLTIGKLLTVSELAEGTILEFDHLDLIDKTPIIDLKPYTVGWDMVLSARNSGEADLYRRLSREELISDMSGQAARYHGKLCIGGMIGVRAAYIAFRVLDTDLRRKDLLINANVRRCTCDALAAVSSASFGRLSFGEPLGEIIFSLPEKTLCLKLTTEKIKDMEQLNGLEDDVLFNWGLVART